MSVEQFYDRIEKTRNIFLLFTIITILFYSGISFTLVIPGLKGFNLFFMFLILLMYFIAAIIFVGLFKDKTWFIFIFCIILSGLGMGWRLWLGWGEFSLVEHMNLAVYIGYPSVIAFIITIFYIIGNSIIEKKLTSN